jgi:hypothetical protein
MLRSWTTAVTVQHVELLRNKIRASVQPGIGLRLQRAAVHKSTGRQVIITTVRRTVETLHTGDQGTGFQFEHIFFFFRFSSLTILTHYVQTNSDQFH